VMIKSSLQVIPFRQRDSWIARMYYVNHTELVNDTVCSSGATLILHVMLWIRVLLVCQSFAYLW